MWVPIHFIKSFLLLFFKKEAFFPFHADGTGGDGG